MDNNTFGNDTMNITCTENARLEKQIEELKQSLHLTKCELERSKKYSLEMEADIEKLETMNKTWESKFEKERDIWSEKCSRLELSLAELREELKEAQSRLVEHAEQATVPGDPLPQSPAPPSDDLARLEEALDLQKIECGELQKEAELQKAEISRLHQLTAQLSAQNSDLRKEAEELREALNSKNQEFKNTLTALETMREEKILLNCELQAVKSDGGKKTGEEKDRGNSLFAEVEDKRQKQEKKMKALYDMYQECKRQLAIKTNECEREKTENMKFRACLVETDNAVQSAEKKLIESYKARIKELSDRIEVLESRPDSPRVVTVSERDLSNLQWIHNLIDTARDETKRWKRNYENQAREKLYAEDKACNVMNENKTLKRENFKDKAALEILQKNYKELEEKCQKYESELNEANALSKKSFRFAEDVKENDGIPLTRKGTKKPNEQNYPVTFIDTTNTKNAPNNT